MLIPIIEYIRLRVTSVIIKRLLEGYLRLCIFAVFWSAPFTAIKKRYVMKSYFSSRVVLRATVLFMSILSVMSVFAQQAAPPAVPDTSRMTYNQISKGLGLYVYPSKGQSQQEQKVDEFECYTWAVSQSGIDPLNLPKVEAPPPQTGPTGGGVVGAAKGAAAGAAIGAIAGDAGKGAAIGAVAGGLAGRRQGKQAQAQANQQAEQQAKAQEQAMKDSFKKAFSVCMEGKGYTIK
jgi:hypothetical protein